MTDKGQFNSDIAHKTNSFIMQTYVKGYRTQKTGRKNFKDRAILNVRIVDDEIELRIGITENLILLTDKRAKKLAKILNSL